MVIHSADNKLLKIKSIEIVSPSIIADKSLSASGMHCTFNWSTGTSIYKIVKKRIKLIGLDETLYGAHSLRAGFITESVNNGKTIYETMQCSGHRDPETALGYYVRLK